MGSTLRFYLNEDKTVAEFTQAYFTNEQFEYLSK